MMAEQNDVSTIGSRRAGERPTGNRPERPARVEQVSLKVGSKNPMIGEIKWALGREAGGHFVDQGSDPDDDG
jgi:hypothetical protein